jgi:predicted acylesterase/phospholipase RssA
MTPQPEAPSKRECDLVMKGGIASGVVYPSAVIALAREGYCFRGIGGTSAGAIAAGLTAAAEHARTHGKLPDPDLGFKRLADVSNMLGREGFIRGLFHPAHGTSALLEVARAVFMRREPRREDDAPEAQAAPARPAGLLTKLQRVVKKLVFLTAALLTHMPLASALGAAAGALLWLACVWALFTSLQQPVPDAAQLFTGRALAPAAAFVFLWLIVGGIIGLARILFREVPANHYGICIGHQPGAAAAPTGILTDWLCWAVDHVACRDLTKGAPLTFGDLKPSPDGQPADDPYIDLRMMTSNVSQGQPYVLPFHPMRVPFLFRVGDMRRLFPAEIVRCLIEGQGSAPQVQLQTAPAEQGPALDAALESGRYDDHFYFLPDADRFPVIVAMRMSLSFPLLISAVPLYQVKVAALGAHTDADPLAVVPERHLQRSWFSDGGISSNFPIHFFDGWLPTRPTFGINLTPYPEAAFDAQTGQVKAEHLCFSHATADAAKASRDVVDAGHVNTSDVYLPPVEEEPVAEWHELRSLVGFLGAIFSTAQNYRDNLQSQLPSYRERIVQIRLKKDEGGLNLDMPREIVAAIVGKGERAGRLLAGFDLDQHRWVRLRVLMAQLEKQLHTTWGGGGRYRARPWTGSQPYTPPPPWAQDADLMIQDLEAVANKWNVHLGHFRVDCPEPEPVLRVTPDV